AFAAALAAYGDDALPAGLADQPGVPADLQDYAGGLNNRMARLAQLYGDGQTSTAGTSVAHQLRATYDAGRAETAMRQRMEELRRQLIEQYSRPPLPQPAQPPAGQPAETFAIPPELRSQLHRQYLEARRLVDQGIQLREWAYRNDPESGVTLQEIQEYKSVRDGISRYEKAFTGGSLTQEELREFNSLLSRLRTLVAR
ncbi:MAG TPA: hypothetical protein VJB16_02875, partial [archaeon]|nr:hypothetical protein [archaeon]